MVTLKIFLILMKNIREHFSSLITGHKKAIESFGTKSRICVPGVFNCVRSGVRIECLLFLAKIESIMYKPIDYQLAEIQ